MSLHAHLRFIGALLIVLALAHAVFPRRFEWKRELPLLSTTTRQIFLVHYFYIAFTLLLFGALNLFGAEWLLRPGDPLGRALLFGFALFWLVRLFVQWFVFDWSLWRGNSFNTAAHFLFTLLWAYLSSVYVYAFARQSGF